MTRLAAAAAALTAAAALAAPPARAAEDDEDVQYEAPRASERVAVTAWGGGLFDLGGSDASGTSGLGGLEVAYMFDALDVGILGQGYHLGKAARTPWAPIVLARVEQRFETRRGLEAVLALGLGAGRTTSWIAWYQLAFGIRISEGPLFIAGELGFEQLNLLRLAGGVGVRF